MKKRLFGIGLAALSLIMLSACSSGASGTGSNTSAEEKDVDNNENGAGHEEERGRISDEDGNAGDSVSGSVIPVVSGTLTPVDDEEEELEVTSLDKDVNKPKGEELMAIVSTEEEARDIAVQYGIELVTFAQGVATYHTEEDPGSVVQRGRDNGWPPLAVNAEYDLID